jgi:hypothetical protein
MRTIVLMCVGVFGLAMPALGDPPENPENYAGGQAADHRSQQAVENSNAQWQEGATRGLERAAQRRTAPIDEFDRRFDRGTGWRTAIGSRARGHGHGRGR